MTNAKEDNLPLGVALKKSFISHEMWSKYYISFKTILKALRATKGKGNILSVPLRMI